MNNRFCAWFLLTSSLSLIACGSPAESTPDSDGGHAMDTGHIDTGMPVDTGAHEDNPIDERDSGPTETDSGPTETDSGPMDVDAGPLGCTSDTECVDAVDCTTDTCVVATGDCRHVVTPALCGAGESCNPMTGCEIGAPARPMPTAPTWTPAPRWNAAIRPRVCAHSCHSTAIAMAILPASAAAEIAMTAALTST